MLNQIYRLLVRVFNALGESLCLFKQIEDKLDRIAQEQRRQASTLDGVAQELRFQAVTLDRILQAVEPLPAVGVIFSIELEGQIETGVTQTTMTNSQQATATIQPVDKKGNPAPVDGVPEWASSDETIVTVVPAADGMSAVVAAVGPLGTAKVSVTADADTGAGVKPIFGSIDVTVTQGLAVGITIVLGEATEQGTGVPTPPDEPPVV